MYIYNYSYTCNRADCFSATLLGVKVVAECLANCQTQEAQECAQNLLYELSMVKTCIIVCIVTIIAKKKHNYQIFGINVLWYMYQC